MKRVLVLSVHTASSSSVHERRSEKEVATKSERTWVKEGKYGACRGIQMQTSGALWRKRQRG